MIFGEIPVHEAEGAYLAHTLRAGKMTIKKGTRLESAHVAQLQAAGIGTVQAALIEPGDVMENDVARGLAEDLAGDGVEVTEPVAGRCNLHARVAGVVAIDKAIIDGLNLSGDGVLTSTIAAFEPVEPGRGLATIKVVPYAIAQARFDALLEMSGHGVGGGAITVHPFRPMRVGLILSRVEGNRESLLDKAAAVISARIETYAGNVIRDTRVAHEASALADAIAAMQAEADLILILGGASTSDRADVVPAAIEQAGGKVDLFGIPVDPGNLMVLGRLKDVPVLGLPGCARSPSANGVDLILPRFMAAMDVSPRMLLEMGVGGLLKEVPDRIQPRESHGEQAPAMSAGGVAAVVLAGGESKRMGDVNKLLTEAGGTALVRRVVETAKATAAADVIVVTGHEADLVRNALSGLDVRFVHNPHYPDGLSTSLRAGIGAVGEGCSGAVILLGDMPRVTPEIVNALIDGFHDDGDRSIFRPVFDGRPGNPVLWPREFFSDILDIWGDTGAKQLLARYADRVKAVEVGDDAIHFDIDRPEDL